MSINACTISESTLDTFCGRRRSIVLTRLIKEAGHEIVLPPIIDPPTPPKYTGGGHGSTGIRFNPGIPLPSRQPPQFISRASETEFNTNISMAELPYIMLDVELFNMQGRGTVENKRTNEFVTLTDLEFTMSEITINITDLEI
jgi:hypothetical protein